MIEKSTILQLVNIFFGSPTTLFYAADVARETGFSRAAVRDHLATLEKQGFITRSNERRGSRIYPKYVANRDNKEFRRVKMLANIEALYPLVDHLLEQCNPTAIVVFGSYRRGEDIEGSDIDLFVETAKNIPEVKAYEKSLGKKISFYTKDSFTNVPLDLRNNLINGIVLHGYLEATR